MDVAVQEMVGEMAEEEIRNWLSFSNRLPKSKKFQKSLNKFRPLYSYSILEPFYSLYPLNELHIGTLNGG